MSMPVFFNLIGIGIVVVAIIISFLLGSVIGDSSQLLIIGGTMLIIDLVYRSRRKDSWESTPLFHPKRGGNLMFIPVWIIGAVVLMMGFIS
jgi:hypothetical protein